MKKIVVIALLLAGGQLFAQGSAKSNAPHNVQMAFYKNFPGVHEVKWERENGNYEANFREGGQKTSATFDKTGKWLETERAIAITALPPGATSYIEKNFNGKIARKASVITTAGGDTNYEAHISGKDYIFDATGKFLRTEKD